MKDFGSLIGKHCDTEARLTPSDTSELFMGVMTCMYYIFRANFYHLVKMCFIFLAHLSFIINSAKFRKSPPGRPRAGVSHVTSYIPIWARTPLYMMVLQPGKGSEKISSQKTQMCHKSFTSCSFFNWKEWQWQTKAKEKGTESINSKFLKKWY